MFQTVLTLAPAPHVQELISSTLGPSHRVVHTALGYEALYRMLCGLKPDVIVAAGDPADMPLHEFISRLRSNPALPAGPVVVLDAPARRPALPAGCVMLSRSAGTDLLKQTLHQALAA